jgi:uncharacterized membrane protein YhaH (DUF805 family)
MIRRPFHFAKRVVTMSIIALLFSFNGRIGRLLFWGGALIHTILTVLLFALVFVISDVNPMLFFTYWVFGVVALLLSGSLPDLPAEANAEAFALADALALGALLIIGWISLALCVKRWHDRGKSGWWHLITFVPMIGVAWASGELALMPGTRGDNRYGPPGGTGGSSAGNWRDGADSGIDADAIIARYRNRPVPDVPLVAPAAIARRQAAAQPSGFGRRGLR